jgi:hypothetical protein
MMSDWEEELESDERKLRAALEGGAVVSSANTTLKDALPEEPQMRLPFRPQLVYRAAG